MTSNGEWDGVTERRQGERRERGPPDHVLVDGLSNGAKKLALRIVWGLVLVGFTSGGWLARQEFINSRQDQEIAENETANRVVDEALSEAVKELSNNIRQVVEDQQDLRREMDRNREGIGILDAEKDAIRRDFEREHGRRP